MAGNYIYYIILSESCSSNAARAGGGSGPAVYISYNIILLYIHTTYNIIMLRALFATMMYTYIILYVRGGQQLCNGTNESCIVMAAVANGLRQVYDGIYTSL